MARREGGGVVPVALLWDAMPSWGGGTVAIDGYPWLVCS